LPRIAIAAPWRLHASRALVSMRTLHDIERTPAEGAEQARREKNRTLEGVGCRPSPTGGRVKRSGSLAFSRLRCIAAPNLNTQAGILRPRAAIGRTGMGSSSLGGRRDRARTHRPDMMPAFVHSAAVAVH
jgi:hypothetical protein